MVADRDTDRKKRTTVTDPFGPGPLGYWGVSWRYHRPGFGWGHDDPYFGGGPFGRDDFDLDTIDRYEAHAEIVMGHGAPPSGNVYAFDAHQVLQNLESSIQMPHG